MRENRMHGSMRRREETGPVGYSRAALAPPVDPTTPSRGRQIPMRREIHGRRRSTLLSATGATSGSWLRVSGVVDADRPFAQHGRAVCAGSRVALVVSGRAGHGLGSGDGREVGRVRGVGTTAGGAGGWVRPNAYQFRGAGRGDSDPADIERVTCRFRCLSPDALMFVKSFLKLFLLFERGSFPRRGRPPRAG